MGLCSSAETKQTKDEDQSVAEKAEKENESIRQQDHLKRKSKHSAAGVDASVAHVPGALDYEGRSSSMASRTLQKMIHTQSSADISIDDLYEGMGRGKVLGTGITGAVRIVKNKRTGKEYAHKLLRVSRVRSARKRNQMRMEVDVLKTLDHPNIVKIQEVFEYPNGDLSLFMELLEGDELFERLIQEKPYYRFIEGDVKRIAYKMFASVNYMHVNRLVHRDIKLENFMFTSNDADGDLKLLDFGFSQTYLQGENIKYVAGTPYTMAPEVFTRKAGPPADVWAVAVCIYVLLYGRRPFEGKDRHQIEDKVRNGSFVFLEAKEGFPVSDTVKDLIEKCLVKDPTKRYTASDALKHPFFTDISAESQHKMKMLTKIKASDEEVNDVIDHLWAFSEMGKLRKVVLLAVSHTLTAKEISGLNSVFAELDLTKDGTIGFVELTHAIQKHSKVEIPDNTLKKLFNSLDQDKSGLIKYSEFIAACIEQNITYTDGIITDAFSRMDLDKSGYITRQNLTDLMRTRSDELTDDQVEETVDRMLSEGDLFGDGQISLEELKEVMRSPMKKSNEIYNRTDSASSVESITFNDLQKQRKEMADVNDILIETKQ